MVNRDTERIDRIVNEVLKQTNNRGVVLSGWSNVEYRSSDTVLYLNAIPHDWLLSRCKMIVHHGGAGTIISAGLRAGIPNVIIPFTADQPFWGRRAYAIGVAPKPILVKNLSVKNLTHAIVEASDNVIRKCTGHWSKNTKREGCDACNTVDRVSHNKIQKF
jgi:sterol 3beta-glucosyltransferase